MSEQVVLPGSIVSGEWLVEHLDQVALLDCRWYMDGRSGRAAYETGHIPGALFADLDTDLSTAPTATGGRHPLPPAGAVLDLLGRWGIDEQRPVVVYDDAGGSIAARAWWMLHLLGQPVAVLDGGLAAWPGSLTTDVPAPVPVEREQRDWPVGRFLDIDEVEPFVSRPDAVLLDARATPRYEQGDPKIDPRPGHVPGARSAPWAGNLDPATGRFLPAEALAARFAALGVTGGAPVGAYCGSGVTACHDLLALTIAGVETTALFTGSWSAWGADTSRPAAVGPDRS